MSGESGEDTAVPDTRLDWQPLSGGGMTAATDRYRLYVEPRANGRRWEWTIRLLTLGLDPGRLHHAQMVAHGAEPGAYMARAAAEARLAALLYAEARKTPRVPQRRFVLDPRVQRRYAAISKAEWASLYFDLYRRTHGAATDREVMADAEKRLNILRQ